MQELNCKVKESFSKTRPCSVAASRQPKSRLTVRYGPQRRDIFRTGASRRDIVLGGVLPCCCGACQPKSGWYDKFFASVMATGMDTYEDAVRPFKQDLLQTVRQAGPQKVMEVGIGAAPNLQYFVEPSGPKAEGLEVIGIDPNPFMFDYARDKAKAVGLPPESLELQLGVAEALPVPTSSLDTIICTLVLCSVKEVSAAVKEMQRVLKPGGKVFFLEHVLASEDRQLLRLGQRILNPVQELLADGCHLTRNPLSVFEGAGFQSVDAKLFDVPGLGVLGPHVSGIARV